MIFLCFMPLYSRADGIINLKFYVTVFLHRAYLSKHDAFIFLVFCFKFLSSLWARGYAPNANEDERNAQYLSHVHRQTGLEGYLNLLRIFDEEAEGEDEGEAKSEVETGAYALRSFLLVDEEDDEEEAEVSQRFVKLTRVARVLVFANEDESPRHIGHLADNL